MYKLAYIGKIVDIQPIKGADFIVSAIVVCGEGGKWCGTVQKDQFNKGDLCEVYLQDAILPKEDRFSFLERYKYRISMKRFKGVPSECLIMPLTVEGNIGDNIADTIGVMKYSKPVHASLHGLAKGSFPTNIIPKTDEPNFQTANHMVYALQGNKFYSTVKADGSSGTIYKTIDGKFGCCSRNLELKDGDNAVWNLARKYNIENKIPEGYAIQFEMVGPGIQKNPLGLDELEIRVFQVWNIEKRKYLNAIHFLNFCKTYNLPTVDIIDWDETFSFTSDEQLRKYAEGRYPSGRHREGVVIRPMVETRVKFERLSFKIINLNYKD
jgi:RNA ligase (TIGR02306 family)